MLCAIWYNLHNLKNLKNTHGGMILLVKLLHPTTLLKVTLLYGCFSLFKTCANANKSHKASHMKHCIVKHKNILDPDFWQIEMP